MFSFVTPRAAKHLALCGLGLFLAANQANAVTLSLTPFTGSGQVDVTLTQINANSVLFDVQVVPTPIIGDLRGVFFNISNDSLLAGLSIAGTHVTQVVKDANNVTQAGGGNNINPQGPFDIGVEIGTPGIGSDDIQFTSFTVSSVAPLSMSLFLSQTDPGSGSDALYFAARMTSVGTFGGDRSGSSKLGTSFVPPPQFNNANVPEPGSVALFAGLVATGVFGFARRRRSR